MVWKIIGIIVIIALIGGGVFYMMSRQNSQSTAESDVTPTASEVTESPTPEEVNKEEFTVKILNGSGIAGEAGRAQKLLEDDKFKVQSTGNADNYDYEETVIKASEDVSEAWIDELKNTLKKEYKVESKVEVNKDTDADVVVIIGSFDESGKSQSPAEEKTESTEEAETATPTPTTSN